MVQTNIAKVTTANSLQSLQLIANCLYITFVALNYEVIILSLFEKFEALTKSRHLQVKLTILMT